MTNSLPDKIVSAALKGEFEINSEIIKTSFSTDIDTFQEALLEAFCRISNAKKNIE